MGGISKTTRDGIILHGKWRREARCLAPAAGGRVREDRGLGDGDRGPTPSVGGVISTVPSTTQCKQRRVGGGMKAPAHFKAPRVKKNKNLSPQFQAAAERAKAADVRYDFPPLGLDRFDTMDEFVLFVTEYFARLYGGYRRRSSLSTLKRNDQLREQHEEARLAAEKANKPFTSTLELLPSNASAHKYLVVYWCVHGVLQKSRGSGQRMMCSTRYTGCLARITAQLYKDDVGPDGVAAWYVKIMNEYPTHNHHVGEVVYKTYNTTSMLVGEDELFRKVAWAVDVGGDPRIVRDIVSRATGANYSQRKYSNLVRYWLGGAPVLKSLQDLIEAFAALPGYRVLVIKDTDGVLVGLVLQSAVQRALVPIYGDALVLDWTHNTNNRGFRQGALVATTANGTSVSMLDFLCITQSNKMMETVFNFYIEHNPGAKERLRSVVIDKDFGEWKTVEKVFSTTVVLCIFHVLKWFKFVVTQPKYSLGLAIREDVLACLTAMVYAVSADAMEAQKNTLRLLLSPDTIPGHEAFLTYLDVNWYAHSAMWSYAERGCIFTAGNTTSNRIESWWHSYKGTLGARRRLDSCVEAIFEHATMILRREESLLAAYVGKTPLYPGADKKILPVLMELSAYNAKRVQVQWTKYLARRDECRVIRTGKNASAIFTVRYAAVKPVDFEVDTANWSCSCRSFRAIEVPCRHLLFIAFEELRLQVYPIIAIKSRWRMSEAAKLLPTVTQNITQLESLRSRLLRRGVVDSVDNDDRVEGADVAFVEQLNNLVDDPMDDAMDDEEGENCEDEDLLQMPTIHFAAPRSIAHVHLRKGEVSDSRVLHDLEKRNQCDAALEPLVNFATGLSTADFKTFLSEVDGSIAALLRRWQSRTSTERVDSTVQEEERVDSTVQEDPSSLFRAKIAERRAALNGAEYDEEIAEWHACRASPDDEIGADFEDEEDEFTLASRPCSPPLEAFDAVTLPTLRANDRSPASDGNLLATMCADEGDDGHDYLDPLEEKHQVDQAIRLRLLDQHGKLFSTGESSSHLDDILRATDSEDEVARGSNTKRPGPQLGARASPDGADSGRLESTTFILPPERGRGHRKTSKQQAPAARPTAYVGQSDKSCPIEVWQHNVMVQFCVPREAARLQGLMPVVLTESTVYRRHAKATQMSFMPRSVEHSNAVVPHAVYDKLLAAVTNQRIHDGTGKFEKRPGGDARTWVPQYVAQLGQLRTFPEELLMSIGEFYTIQSKIRAYNEDMAWVSGQWDVGENVQRVPFLQADANCVEGALDALQSTKMRAELKHFHETRVLATLLAVPETGRRRTDPGQRTCMPLLEIVGRLAFNQKLNDSVLNFSLQLLGAEHSDVVVVDSLNVGKMRLPRSTLQSTRVICFPLHDVERDHWCIVIVERKVGLLQVWGYDPTGHASGKVFMQGKWDEWCRLLISAWNSRDQKQVQVRSSVVVDVTTDVDIVPVPGLDALKVTFLAIPRQPDGTSCGLFCVAQAAAFMSGRFGFQSRERVAPFTVQLMRLRLMWLVLCRSTAIVDTEKETEARTYYSKFASFAKQVTQEI